uniref:Uncharacterized protein n=1 Tax=Craspedostauros australis TaxID=1486917 RepID=A0A7R9WT75_9STRA
MALRRAYLNTILWPAAVQIVFRAIDAEGRRGEPGLYILRLAAMLCFPLQGMLNFLVFISPKYQLWRQAMPYEPWTYVLHCAMKESNPPTRPPTHNNENTTKNRSSKRKSPLSAEAALIQNRIPVSVIKQLQRRQRRDQLDEIVTRTDSVVPTSTLQRSCQDDNDDDNDDNDDDNHDDNHDAPASWSARTTPVGGIVKLRIVHEAVPSDDGQHGTRDESDLSDDSSGAIEDNDDDVEDSDEEDYCVSGGVPDCV